MKACICLHNYLKSTDAIDHQEPRYVPEHYVDYETVAGEVILGDWRSSQEHSYGLCPLGSDLRPSRMHYGIREKFKTYFSSNIGKLPWQDDYVRQGAS